jgi:threonine/homoserine/homoserine lactone efflux protein
MLAIFPQFLKTDQGPLWLQSGVLGAITAVTQIGVYGALAFASSQASGWFSAHPRAAVVTARAMGVLLIVTALLSASHALRELAPDWRPSGVTLVVGGRSVR